MSSPTPDPSSCLEVTCTTTCEQPLPETSWSLCNPEVNYGEIDAIFVTNIGNPLTNENDPSEWANRMSLPLNDPTRIDEWHVMAEKPAAESSELKISRDITVVGQKTHNLTGEVYQTNNTNYNAMRQYECAKKVLFWYRTAGGKLYGGATGIEGSFIINHIIPKSRKELQVFSFSLKWEAQYHPCVTDSVI
jgi:hypothetical protein